MEKDPQEVAEFLCENSNQNWRKQQSSPANTYISFILPATQEKRGGYKSCFQGYTGYYRRKAFIYRKVYQLFYTP